MADGGWRITEQPTVIHHLSSVIHPRPSVLGRNGISLAVPRAGRRLRPRVGRKGVHEIVQWRHRKRTVVLLVTSLLLLPRVVSTDSTRLLYADDAYVDRGPDQDSWSIGNAGISFSLAFNRDRILIVQQISSALSGKSWLTAPATDLTVNIGGSARPLGARTFRFDDVEAAPRGNGVELMIRFHVDDEHVRITRHYACYPRTPIIESWTTYTPIDARSVQVRDLGAFDYGLRSGTLRSITGLQTPLEEGGSFTLLSRNAEEDGPLDVGSTGRATERALPWFLIDAGSESFFGGLLWSGSWQAHLAQEPGGLRARVGLPPFATTVDAALDTPHAYVGVIDGSTQTVADATRIFIDSAIRHGRPYTPLVTYNTWFHYGTAIDEESAAHEIDAAADLGVELFVLDAGWYKAGTDPWDFTTGIGVWEADADRFPSGLAALSDLAHDRGLKFGIWVEPERVDLRTVGKPGLARDRWLATAAGRYDPSKRNADADSAQICLAGAEGRNWIMDRLSRLIDEVHPDYLKWDNNFWINCDRAGHGHGGEDGNFAHVKGLQQILTTLRERYPDLIIENCSGGGNRLEPGMLAFTDSSWMDDRSLSPPHVRHNLEGLTTLMPPAALLSFVFGNEWAADPEENDVGLSFRSRMPGILGATWRSDELNDESRIEIRREIAIYRRLRDALPDATVRLLSAQVGDEPWGTWDALQETSATTGLSVLFAFENPGAAGSTTVRPQGLRPDTFYDVVSVDAGSIGRASGEELMSAGVEMFSSSASRGHIIELRPIGLVRGASSSR